MNRHVPHAGPLLVTHDPALLKKMADGAALDAGDNTKEARFAVARFESRNNHSFTWEPDINPEGSLPPLSAVVEKMKDADEAARALAAEAERVRNLDRNFIERVCAGDYDWLTSLFEQITAEEATRMANLTSNAISVLMLAIRCVDGRRARDLWVWRLP